LCGTPGYLAPEILKCSMDEMHPGYGKEVDLNCVLIVSVLACIRMYSRYRRARPLTREVLARDPYSLRGVRKLIDGCAFRIYGHWVKKGEQQNRAALFQNTAKIVLLGLEDFET
ncbi:hypothetical protein XENOCAPTIV_000798, partial [Xenoophorus captivus]